MKAGIKRLNDLWTLRSVDTDTQIPFRGVGGDAEKTVLVVGALVRELTSRVALLRGVLGNSVTDDPWRRLLACWGKE